MAPRDRLEMPADDEPPLLVCKARCICWYARDTMRASCVDPDWADEGLTRMDGPSIFEVEPEPELLSLQPSLPLPGPRRLIFGALILSPAMLEVYHTWCICAVHFRRTGSKKGP